MQGLVINMLILQWGAYFKIRLQKRNDIGEGKQPK